MNLTRISSIAVALTLAAGTLCAQKPSDAQTKEANLNAYVDMLRKDVNREKRSVVTELMGLTPAESAKFWPIYDEYDKGLAKLGDDRLALVRLYAENSSSMTNAVATKLATGVIEKEANRIDLKRQFVNRLSKELNPIIAARFLQIELQLEKLIDLQIYSSLPIVE